MFCSILGMALVSVSTSALLFHYIIRVHELILFVEIKVDSGKVQGRPEKRGSS